VVPTRREDKIVAAVDGPWFPGSDVILLKAHEVPDARGLCRACHRDVAVAFHGGFVLLDTGGDKVHVVPASGVAHISLSCEPIDS
jgi:hypothetical protein